MSWICHEYEKNDAVNDRKWAKPPKKSSGQLSWRAIGFLASKVSSTLGVVWRTQKYLCEVNVSRIFEERRCKLTEQKHGFWKQFTPISQNWDAKMRF